MNAIQTTQDPLRGSPPRISRRGVALMVVGVLALTISLLLAALAVWVVVLGFEKGGDAGELFAGLLVLPLLALFVGGLGWLAFRQGREQLYYRERFRYPGY